MKIQAILIAGAIAVATGGLAFAHGAATGIVKERMDAMTEMKDAVKTLTAIMRGETAYDAGTVKKEADTIRSHAGEAMTKLFPADGDNMSSEAKPEIWSDWDGFSALAERLETLAVGLEAAADNGLMTGEAGGERHGMTGMMGTGGSDMMGGGNHMMGDNAEMPDAAMLASMPVDRVFTMMTDSCSACHTRYRQEKN
jgi:cytochrome c556